MKILISPAKSLDFESPIPFATYTQPEFLTYSKKVQAVVKKLSPKDLSELMGISSKLADLNYERNQKWKTPFLPENARSAVYAFSGDVYIGLDAYSIQENQLEQLQSKLRILSGLYGLLKPLDLIQPYRLEMGTSIAIGESKNLYGFWKEKLTKHLNKELSSGEVVVNLASKEYSDAINLKALKVPVITPEFKDYKNGKLSVISFFAKKARGMMVRYIIDNQIENPEDLKGFNSEGYQFDSKLSAENKWVFTR